MNDGFKIIKFVLEHNEELKNRFMEIKNQLPKEFLEDIQDKSEAEFISNNSIVRTKTNKNFVFFARNKEYDRELHFVVMKSLQGVELGLMNNDGAFLGNFYIEDEDELSKYNVILLDTNDKPALVVSKSVRSRENAKVEYEPDSSQICSVSYKDIENLFTDGIKVE